MKINDITLHGERVSLIPLQLSHIEDLYKAVDHPDVWTYLPCKMEKLDDMRKLVNDALQAKETGIEMPFTVFDKVTGEIVGMTRFLAISSENRSLEIGWTWYASKVWRTRVNTECKYLLLKHCFETLHTNRVQLKVDSRNKRSNQAVLRIGATKEGVLRKDRVLYDGYVRSSVYYSIIDDEWTEVKRKLEQFLYIQNL